MNDRSDRRRALTRIGATAALLAAGGCAQVFAPRSIEISGQRLQAELARHFPLGRRFGQGVEVRLDGPRLSLLPEANRLAIDCTLTAGEQLLRRPVSGALTVSFGLGFDASANVLRAVDVRIDVLRIEGVDPAVGRLAERFARPLAEGLLQGQPIYALRPRDIERLQAAGVVPGAIHVTGSGVTIDLVPAGR